MASEQEYKEILGRYLPASAVDPIYNFIADNSIHLHITRKRTSKLGDYRYPQPSHNYHEISVNGDLSPHFFLLVLLHEMAHLNTFLAHGRNVQPHGHEWQNQYRSLLLKYFNEGHFPTEVAETMARYTAHIPLNRAAGVELERKLRELDASASGGSTPAEPELTLSDLPIGSLFRLKNRPQTIFRSIEKRRTRYRCIDQQTRLSYLVSGSAAVEKA